MEDNNKLDKKVNDTVEYTEEEMKKLSDEELEGVAGGAGGRWGFNPFRTPDKEYN